jgi:hypothetical protein
MGNARNRPKAPSPQVIYMPQPVYQTPDTGTDTPDAGSDPTPTPEQQREQSLLSRNRSRLGTILTGFRGLLTPIEQNNQRKTLLGE